MMRRVPAHAAGLSGRCRTRPRPPMNSSNAAGVPEGVGGRLARVAAQPRAAERLAAAGCGWRPARLERW
eukprot:5370558-Prymnesium_polylepis.1